MKISEEILLCIILNFGIYFSNAERFRCNRANLCGCGAAHVSTNTKIINGESTVPYSWSMVVSIRYDHLAVGRSDMHICGGTIVANSYVLTAASCFINITDDVYSKSITVAAGVQRRSQKIQTIRQVDEVIFHPDWLNSRSNLDHNIALLHLTEPLDFPTDRRISKTCLPTEINNITQVMSYPVEHQKLVIVGWGRTNLSDENSDSLKQSFVHSTTLNATECRNVSNDSQMQFCTDHSYQTTGLIMFIYSINYIKNS